MYGYIYRITDLTNGKCYIGQRKWNKPGIDLNYWGSGTIISNIVRKRKKEGRMDTLLREKLMDCATLEETNYFERYFIEHMNTMDPYGYNIQKGGDCHEGQVAWNKGLSINESESLKKSRDKMKATKNSEEYKKLHSGENSTFYGKHHTEEAKEKNRQAHLGKHNTVESIEKRRIKSTKYFISYEELYDLLINQNKTQEECAVIFGCCTWTIYFKCKKYGIKCNSSNRKSELQKNIWQNLEYKERQSNSHKHPKISK